MLGAYVAIDLKSFFASVECVERGLDPLTTNLVVADAERTEKTICLAVSPALKQYGLPGRARLFEVVQKVKEVNCKRLTAAPGHQFTGASVQDGELRRHPELALDYVVARPQMAHYMACSQKIYQIYLRYIAPEDIHVYSIDEVFMDVSRYLKTYDCSPRELAMRMIREVLRETGITATAGIGTNLYLCKIAMDIVAKRCPPDTDGVRIAELDEQSYREQLWNHRPLTDFWRVGPGYARKLEAHQMYTMGDVALRSTYDEDLLYRLFGVNAELLIDHAWGVESCTLAEIKAYAPCSSSMSTGQVLQEPYPFDKARIVIREMADALALTLVEKGLTADQMDVTIGYDVDSLKQPGVRQQYHGPVERDHYGRLVPKGVHGSEHLPCPTASSRLFVQATLHIFDRILNPRLLIRRMYVVANNIRPWSPEQTQPAQTEQLSLFTDYAALEAQRQAERQALARERNLQLAAVEIHQRFGKNALVKGTSFQEGATGIQRNSQIGGHRA